MSLTSHRLQTGRFGGMLSHSMATTAEVITIVKDVATGSAALIAAGVAVVGLRTWQRQLRGQTDYQLARRLLRAVYVVRDEIRNVRNPLILSTEAKEAVMEKAKEEGHVTVAMAEGYEVSVSNSEPAVYEARWRRLSDKLAEMNAELLEAEVSWKDATKHTQPLVNVIKTLGLAIRQ